ncbi:hypothetical protein LCGC14_0702450 [marine sediment metagenome]|uniref:Uncharacterized protein n=1 Tax=marine sediment metagenome TaxID=412755 RepID=A0A0F9R2U9_9ZZZZ
MSDKILYGLWDVQDKLWLGTDECGEQQILLYTDYTLARAAAAIAAKMMGLCILRIRVKEFKDTGLLRKRDEVDVVMDHLSVVKHFEEGGI